MLMHSDFVNWIRKQFPNTDRSLLQKIVQQTAGGVAPEGHGNISVNAIVDAIYKLRFDASPQPIPIQPPPIKFHFGQASLDRLAMLVPELRSTVTKALSISTVDFMVLETIRTEAQQAEAVRTGHSRTMQSKHLRQPDGFAHAVDLGAFIFGKVDWAFDHYADIALAMDSAATSLGFAEHIRWGCSWDRVLSDFGGNHQAYLDEVKAYEIRHVGTDLVDAPHFEWVS